MIEELERVREDIRALTHDARLADEAVSSLLASIRRIERGRERDGIRSIVHTEEPSFRQTVMRVLEEAGGPISAEEILERAKAKGAVTHARQPVNATDLLLWKLRKAGKPVEKVEGQPRTWRLRAPQELAG